jgi:hypothetical protein
LQRKDKRIEWLTYSQHSSLDILHTFSRDPFYLLSCFVVDDCVMLRTLFSSFVFFFRLSSLSLFIGIIELSNNQHLSRSLNTCTYNSLINNYTRCYRYVKQVDNEMHSFSLDTSKTIQHEVSRSIGMSTNDTTRRKFDAHLIFSA